MKRIRCPKCDEPILFDDKLYDEGRTLVFECPLCKKQFKLRIKPKEQAETNESVGYLAVIENVFHLKQNVPLKMGDNVVGRSVKGSKANAVIMTVDPSIDTSHCVISVSRNKQGKLKFILRDGPSNTGTFLMNNILSDKDRAIVSDGDIITIGATTMILHTTPLVEED